VAAIAGASFLVTGGASLIGSHIADVLLAQGANEVRLLDNLSLGTPDVVRHLGNDPRVKVIKGDVLRLNELVDAAMGTAGVFTLAAFLTLPISRNPAMGASVNTMGLINTLEAARIAKVARVVFASSVAVYGGSVPDVMSEETPFASDSIMPAFKIYASSKLFGEGLCGQYAKLYGLEFNALRFSSVYGERQHDRAVNANFIAELYEQVKRGERPVIVGDGTEVHDYIYVTDVADACAAAMSSKSHGHLLNIATGVDTTHTRVAEIVLEACGARNLKPEYRADTRAVKSSASARLNFATAKAERDIGWKAKVPVAEGIRRYIAWRKSNTG
jgi:UDP-glucose 4-epimerase